MDLKILSEYIFPYDKYCRYYFYVSVIDAGFSPLRYAGGPVRR